MNGKLPLAKPSAEMLAWHDAELGVFFHWDIEIYQPDWVYGSETLPDVKIWNPTLMDTDRWLEMARDAGAKYAMLTAKHGTGFCLWPTKVHDYHVGNSSHPVDVVGAFVQSCRKYGIKPGLYYSLSGAHLTRLCRDENGELDRKRFNEMLLAQLEELLTNYGELFEIWFDGGVLRPEKGGPDVLSVIRRTQPNIVVFGGCPGTRNVLRWSGSEQGVAIPECWSAAHYLDEPERNNVLPDSPGDPADPIWAPVECDMPVRDVMRAFMGGWMYHKDDADTTYSGDYLFARYLTSVGRNANLLIGCVPDTQGLISPDQQQAFRDLGRELREAFGNPAAVATEMQNDALTVFGTDMIEANYIEITEDQSEGQKVLSWVLESRWPEDWCTPECDRWIPVAEGKSIGHKRIIDLHALRGYAFRVRILDAYDGAKLTSLKVYGRVVPMKGHSFRNV